MKIKILQYTGAMNRAGAETLLMNVYRNIDRNKYEFHFISHTKEICDYDEEIKKLGGKIIYLERPILKNIKKYKINFKKIIEENGPYECIHSHMQLMNGMILKTAKITGIKKRICHAHSNGDEKEKNLLRIIYEYKSKQLITRNSTYKLACSKQAGDYLYIDEKYNILTNAIDINNFKEREENKYYIHDELNLDKNIKIITHVGRFITVKNHRFLIKVFNEVIKKDKNIRLLLCGDGELKEEIINLVKSLNLEEYVFLLGIRSDINKILLSTDLYFMPSILEGLPVTLIEAQAAGCSCVISNNIPKEVDINAGLVQFLDLNIDEKIWRNLILDTLKNTNKLDYKTLNDKMNENGYSLDNNIKLLEELYKI